MKSIIALLLTVVLAVGVTGPKLYKMCQIKGWFPGATVTQETITQKWNQTPAEHPSGRNTYWVAFSDADIHKRGDHRVNLPADDWNKLSIGDPIEVVRLESERRPYLRNGIFVSVGNFIFDCLLLFGEITVAVVIMTRLIRNRGVSAE